MKNLRLMAFLVFVVCTFSLLTMSQTIKGSKPTQWVYKAKEEGTEKEITIIITRRPNGYEVTGEYTQYYNGQGFKTCKFRGTYFPATGRLAARCSEKASEGDEAVLETISGSRRTADDAFQVEVRGSKFLAKREGAKSKNTSTNETSVVGTWKWAYAEKGDPEEHGTVTFNADGTMDWSGDSHGTWTQSGVTVELQWDKKIKDTMTLIEGGKKLKGTNTKGWTVIGTRP